MSDFYLGLFSGLFIFSLLEPLIINFIYFSNISLFKDIILTAKNRQKLEIYYNHLFLKEKSIEVVENENKKV